VHIGLFSPSWPPAGSANGIVSYVSAVREQFLSLGHDVSVISHDRLHLGDAREIPIDAPRGSLDTLLTRIGRRVDRWQGDLPGVGRSVVARVAAVQRVAPIDILEMEESFGWCNTVQRATGVPVVTRLHGPFFLKPDRPRTVRERYAHRGRCRAEGRAVRAASALTAPTRAMMDVTCAEYDRPSAALNAVIPNPIAVAPERARWRLDACDRNHILMVGRFDYWKGADTMLLAFEKLLERRPAARLTLVGPDMGIETAPGHSIDFAGFAQSNLSPLARERITFTGKLLPTEIARLRKDAYVTVMASRGENFPYALLEGFAAASPMISTRWPGSEEIILDGRTGLLTPIGEPDALAHLLDRILGDPDLASRIAQGGMQRCREHFSVQAVATQLLDFYGAVRQRGAK